MGLVVVLALSACRPPDYPIPGVRAEDYFPTDGARRAEYVNAAPDEVPWVLVVEKLHPTEQIGNVEVVTFEWTHGETGDLLGAVKWAQDDGIAIYGWSQAGGPDVTFDPPLVVADQETRLDEQVETTTGGTTFTSTFVGSEDCPVAWGVDWTDCLHFVIDDGDGDPMAGPLFAGDYWLVPEYGPAWMHTTGYTGKWDLQDYEWEPD